MNMAARPRDGRRLPFHSLFTRIFLWFWVAIMLVGMALLVSESSSVEQKRARWQRMTADAFGVYANSAAEAHEDDQKWETREYLADLEQQTGIRAWLFDQRGREVSGYKASKRSADMARRIRLLAHRARQSQTTEFEPLGSVTLAAHAAQPIEGERYVLVGELPNARFGALAAEPHIQITRLLAVFFTASAVCWGLGRYLTRPIVALRGATQRLAAGDLRARAGASLGARHDELADLSRDFDAMAARIERLLEEQNLLVRAQRRLLGDVSHELRSPLARLGVAIELARDHLESDDKEAVAATLNRIERETARQGELIDRLLTLSRLESGLQKRGAASVDLAVLLQAVAADADFEARSHRRAVRVTLCEPCTLLGTPDLLRSALENVVRNAVRYTPENTEVEISLRCAPDETALIRVADQGRGVPETELEAIFRPFHRTSGARDRASGGAGLGLTIAARAVELHGGQIGASNAAGGGLVIEIRLPLESGQVSNMKTAFE
ncbi:MAG: HAMP domain-containing protein [Armatimonadetes bacterium]|nr:HAMP domain-containing protein [Armatimonadota bacterium]